MAKRVTCVNPLAPDASPNQCKCMADKDKRELSEREKRLAAALRENLRRRKVQARELKPQDKPKRG